MELRKTGIELIGDVPWGTHISQVYSAKDDFFKTSIPFIQKGLSNNELCIWIYSSNTDEDEIRSTIKKSVPDVDSYIKKGQLKILPYTEWYVKEDSFNEVRINKQWVDLIEYCVRSGYDGMRAVADTSWLEKSYSRKFAEYEKNINKLVSELPFIVICLYDSNKIGISEFSEIVSNHGYVVLKDNGGFKVLKNVELLVKNLQLEKSREEYKKLEKYDQMKTEFFSNLSHELRTPLNVILSTLQLMRIKKATLVQKPDERNYFSIMQQNCYRLLRLVNNLIDITKIDSNFFELKLCNCNIVEVVENITMSVAEYIESKGITLKFDTNIEEKMIACDPDQIERVILNLLSNAMKFTPQGGRIWVKILDDDDKVKIKVRDNGIGIPKNKQDIIFDRFQQVNKSFSRHHEGSGIGLSLVKSLIEKHGGDISLKSQEGKGSEFILELPCKILPGQITDTDSEAEIVKHKQVERAQIEFSDIYA